MSSDWSPQAGRRPLNGRIWEALIHSVRGEPVELNSIRMLNQLMRRLEDKKLSDLTIVAIQLEIEDEDLHEWREKAAEISKESKTETS
ncbi:MAG: hypothetical protein GC183_04340 [Thiobacillus sp.]|nr:hypothetical protein [Thiobacillus sp.]